MKVTAETDTDNIKSGRHLPMLADITKQYPPRPPGTPRKASRQDAGRTVPRKRRADAFLAPY